MLLFMIILIIQDYFCVEGENPLNYIEITIFSYLLNFLSTIPLFIQYFLPADPVYVSNILLLSIN